MRPAFIAIPAAAVLLAGCGASSPPKPPAQSSARACLYFTTWLEVVNANVASGKGTTILSAAVSSAPSGELYQDLSTLQSNVEATVAAAGTSLASADKVFTLTDVQQVQADCASVNPG